MQLDTWHSPTNWPSQMTIDPDDDLERIVCEPHHQIADMHSQSDMPANERRKMAWRVVGVCRGVHRRWLPTEDCPYLDSRDPFEMIRKAVQNGDLITAQKKLAPLHYELWAQIPKGAKQ